MTTDQLKIHIGRLGASCINHQTTMLNDSELREELSENDLDYISNRLADAKIAMTKISTFLDTGAKF